MKNTIFNKKKILIIFLITLTFCSNLLIIKKKRNINTQIFYNKNQNLKRIKRNLLQNNCPIDGKIMMKQIKLPQNDLLEESKRKIKINWEQKIEKSEMIYLQKINMLQKIENFDLLWIENEKQKLNLENDHYRQILFQIIGKEKNDRHLNFLKNLDLTKIVIEKIQEIIPKIENLKIPNQQNRTLSEYQTVLNNIYQEIETKIINFENQYQEIENQYFINLETKLKTKINNILLVLKNDHQEIKNLINQIKQKNMQFIDPKSINEPEILKTTDDQNLNIMIKNFIIFNQKNDLYLTKIDQINEKNEQITNNINDLNEQLCFLIKKINT